jgi:hypothetical protein
LIELNRQLLSFRHLAEIRKVCADDGNSISARQMGNATAAGGGRIWHHRHRGALEKMRQCILMHIPGELNLRVSRALFFHGFHVACSLRMVSSSDYKLCVRKRALYHVERFDHEFQTFIGPPLTKCQDAVLGIATPGKVRILGAAGQNPMRAHMDVVPAIFFVKDFSIARHEYRNRICKQEHPSGKGACQPVGARKTYPRVPQINRVHQMVQGDVRVVTSQTSQQRGHEARECNQRLASKSAEQKIEPNYIRLQLLQGSEKANGIRRVIKFPATQN